MIEKIHHIGIAVQSLEEARVILSDDHPCPRHSSVSRRNLGSGGEVDQTPPHARFGNPVTLRQETDG